MERNLCILILLSAILNAKGFFWFSYRIITHNKIITYEEKNISPHMIEGNFKKLSTCVVKINNAKSDSNLHLLNKNFNKILPCFYPYGSRILSKTDSFIGGIEDINELVIPPTKFTVDFKDQFANITIVK